MVLKDKKTKITFHNGLRTIGGTIIEIIYEDSHIFFDFGSEYNPAAPVQPTDLQSLLDLNLMPFVDNLFDKTIDLKGYESKENTFKNTAVFLSHVHLDHSKVINYLDESIPLYALKGTQSLLNTLNINNDFLFARNGEHKNNTRDVIGLDDNESVNIGKIKVTLMPVDHDAYGSCGMKIETPDLTITYTGDIRIHGYRKQNSLDFCRENFETDVLIIEGVSVSFRDIGEDVETHEEAHESEVSLIEEIKEVLENNKNKQLTFNYYISNIERIEEIIKASQRKVVLDSYYAYVVKQATGYDAYYYDLTGIDYGLNKEKEISFDVLAGDEKEYLFQLSDNALKQLDKLKNGGIYIHSNAVPLFEGDPAYKPFMDNFAKKDIEVKKIACSGHAFAEDLIKLINLIKPKLLVPIHSFHPERLYNESGDRLLPEKGQTI